MNKKSHRKRYSRKSHTNIMVNRKLKSILDNFKLIIIKKEKKEFIPSYNDVIIYLAKQYLKKELNYVTKNFSLNFATRKTSFRIPTSYSFNFENR